MPAGFDYVRARRTAERLIARFGQIGAIRPSGGALGGDSTNGLSAQPDAAQAPADRPCTLVVLDFTQAERANTLIEQDDRKVLVSTSGVTVPPTNDDALVVGDDVYRIVTVMPVAPGPVTVLWKVQARR